MLKVRLDFCDFWPGFSKTDNFFYRLLQERFEVELCDQPDFLIFANPQLHAHRIHDCVKIYWCVEDFLPDFKEYDYSFTHREIADPRNLRFPYYALYKPERLNKDHDDFAKIMASKTEFCCFLAGYASPKTRVRNEFFQKLCRYKKVDSAGRALNNMGRNVPPGTKAKLEFMQPYKFNIAFENASVPGYTTEKIVDAMISRTMPIYWGNPGISTEFNPKSFLNYFDFPSEEALIEKIIELDQDEAKYLDYLRQPYFHGNQPNIYFSHERLLDQFEKIFTTPIKPVSSKRRLFQVGRWIPVLKNRPARPN